MPFSDADKVETSTAPADAVVEPEVESTAPVADVEPVGEAEAPPDVEPEAGWVLVKKGSPESVVLPHLLPAAGQHAISGPYALKDMKVVEIDPENLPADIPPYSVAFGFPHTELEWVGGTFWEDSVHAICRRLYL